MRLTEAEITRIAAFLNRHETDFIQHYTRLQQDRRGLALQEKPDGACVLLEGNLCSIQPVKPQQCRDFPNLWKYPEAAKYCRAIPREVSEADYVRLVSAATGRSAAAIREILRRTAAGSAQAPGDAALV